MVYKNNFYIVSSENCNTFPTLPHTGYYNNTKKSLYFFLYKNTFPKKKVLSAYELNAVLQKYGCNIHRDKIFFYSLQSFN